MPNTVGKSNDAVAAKATEIKKALAKQTGVSLQDVEKIMDRLGLENSLRHRQYVEDTAGRQKITNAPILQVSKVNADLIRIASGPVPI